MITDVNKWCEGIIMSIMEDEPESQFTWFAIRNQIERRIYHTTDFQTWIEFGVFKQIQVLQKTLTKLTREKRLNSHRYSAKQFYSFAKERIPNDANIKP